MAKNIKKLQRIQNWSAAARLIFLANRRDNTSTLIKELHWLPVKEQILFKTVLLTYRCLNNPAPIYLTELLQIYIPSANLHSGLDQPRLVFNRTSTTFCMFGNCAFQNAAPQMEQFTCRSEKIGHNCLLQKTNKNSPFSGIVFVHCCHPFCLCISLRCIL